MKKVFLIFASAVFLNVQASGQAPSKFNYQGVARSAVGTSLANQNLGVKISILDGNGAGAVVLYAETQSITTNASGLYNLAIGGGTVVTGTLGGVDWGTGDRFIKVEMDPAGGTSYADLGTTQLLSVPYALYSMNGKEGPAGPTGPKGDKGDQGSTGDQGPKGDPGTVSATGWALVGNASTTDANFIGTTDNKPLIIKVNNSKAGYVGPISSNTSWGYGALNSVTDKANKNTAVGFNALFANKDGQMNAAFGTNALASYLGNGNVAVGGDALSAHTKGDNNVAIGFNALQQSIDATGNIAIGAFTLAGSKLGNYNISMGIETQMPPLKGDLTSGAIGMGVGNYISGSNSIGIGYAVYIEGKNSTAIGSHAKVSGDNIIHFGNASITEISGQVSFSTYSDQRIKKNVKNNVPGLVFINKLRPVTYNLDIHTQNELLGVNTPNFEGKYDIEKIVQTGFIAQEVEEAAQQTGFDFNGVITPKNDKDLYKVSYAEFVVPLVKAVQEQQGQIEQQQAQIQNQQEQIKNQQDFNNSLKLLLNQQQLKIDQQEKSINSIQNRFLEKN